MNDYTKIFVEKLPYWFKMKKQPLDSIGTQFLNVFGLEYQQMREILEYAFEQIYLNTMDINYLDIVYKAYLNLTDINNIKHIETDNYILTEAKDLSDFFNITFDYYENKNNYDTNVYILDTNRNVVYVKNEYDKNNNYKNGKIIVVSNDNVQETLNLIPHAVWNFFDEIGLLLNCPRLSNESNYKYKERILNIFKYPQSSNKEGFLNAIANELAIRKTIIWFDTSKDLIISDKMIIVNKISVNGNLVNLNDIYVDENNQIIIKSNPLYKINSEVSYISNIEFHILHDKNDIKLDSELFNLDGTATDLLVKYFNKIHSVSPIVWNKFSWDKAYWDTIEEEKTGLAYLPNLLDGKIEGFVNYLK